MAVIPIAVMWDSRKKSLSVHPELATLLDKEDDEAEWVLLSDDPGVKMHPSKSVVFERPPKGPFDNLGRDPKNPKKAQGKGLIKKEHPETFKYTVRLSNGALLDPALRREPD